MRTLAALGVALFCGCATVIPAQTASTVAPGSYRLGAQVTATPYCTVGTTPIESCQAAPTAGNGTPAALLPEVRLSGRYGLARGWDLGFSAHAVPSPGGAFRAGAFVDGKHELWSSRAGDTRTLVSIGLGGGLTAGLPTATRAGLTQVEVAVPVFAGWQMPSVEWVLSPRVVERLAFADVDGDGRRELLPVTDLGLALGVFTRSTPSFFAQLAYTAPTSALAQGPLTLGIGVTVDVERAAPARAED